MRGSGGVCHVGPNCNNPDVRPSGARSYVVLYRPAGEGRRAVVRRVTIDTVGKITPDEARVAAKRIIAQFVDFAIPALRQRFWAAGS